MLMHVFTRSRIVLLSLCICSVALMLVSEHLTQEEERTVDVLECEALENRQQIPCVVDAVVEAAKTVGIEQASAMVAEAIKELPALENECHGIMHVLGEEAYILYKDGVSLDITERSTMCTYGFYHGFITATVLTEGSFDRAQEFCAYVNEELSSQGLDSQSECYHGFGHAVVDDHVSTQVLTATEVVDTALGLCSDLSREDAQFRNCAGGVFNAVANIFTDHTYPWPEIQEENGEVALCNAQEPALQATCFGYFARAILADHRNDLEAALHVAYRLVPETYTAGLRENMAAIFMVGEPNKAAMETHIVTCRELPREVQTSCIAGLAVGVIQSVDPERFDTALSTVCAYDTLNEEERHMCYSRVLTNISHLVSNDALQAYCSSIPVSMRNEECL